MKTKIVSPRFYLTKLKNKLDRHIDKKIDEKLNGQWLDSVFKDYHEKCLSTVYEEYDEAWFSGASKKYNQSQAYEQFLFNFKLRRFKSASKIALGIDYSLLSVPQKLVVIKCYYSSFYGVLADKLLDALYAEILYGPKRNTKLVVAFLERVSISGYDFTKKISILHDAKKWFNTNDTREKKDYYAVLWIEYSVHYQENGATDPKSFIEAEGVDLYDWDLLIKFIPSLNAFGHSVFVRNNLVDLYNREGLRNASYLSLFFSYLQDYIVNQEDIEFDIPQSYESASLLSLLHSGKHLHEKISNKYDEVYDYFIQHFGSMDLNTQDAFLKFLVKKEKYSIVLQLAKTSLRAAHLMPVYVANGFTALAADDYFSARDSFQRVLVQDPSDTLAATGIRFALPRVGRSMQDIINLRDRIGYGTAGAGRSGARDVKGELTISLLMSGDYIRGQYSKRYAKHWLALKSHYGNRFLNYERLNDKSGSTIFLIGDEGVGDEVRTAQFYTALSSFYRKVIVSCDPRLLDIFNKSFPDIQFIPVDRLKNLSGNFSVEKSVRLNGFGEKISKYLTEDCRYYLNSSDLITFGQNVFFNYVLGDILRPKEGPYLRLPNYKNVIPNNDKLKIGILWRSHIRTGARKMMYLDVNDFAPLLKIDGVELWSIQHSMDEDEIEYCLNNGIRTINDIDMFNDFQAFGNYLCDLDLLVGISSLPIELGAALGIETWMLGFSPENYFLRTAGGVSSHDRYTLNSTVIAPPWIDFSNSRELCVQQVFDEVLRFLDIMLKGKVNEMDVN
ncbi:hypothetical protein [Billgrantia montanilacus]|uniref:hypothetical protein n=1 Tax=Billgrantia montanilacus TaxID=2282305 RepID=UPI0011C031CF|nr:hypothetical protein [Halomonas montanilacus]